MTEAFEHILGISGTVFDMLITTAYLKAFFGKDNIRVKIPVFNIIVFVLFTIGMILSQLNFPSMFYAGMTVFIISVLTVLFDTKTLKRIFAAGSYTALCLISEWISYVICGNILSGLSEPSFSVYSLMLSKIVLFLNVTIINLIMKKHEHDKHGKEQVNFRDYLSFLITPLISISVTVSAAYETEYGKCIAAVGMMVINIIVYYILENITEANEMREKQAIMERQFSFQEKKYEQTSQSFKSISSVLHDTNKHFAYLSECLERGEYEEAKNYLRTAAKRIDSSYKRVITGYLPVDALVSNALNICENNNIRFRYDIKIEGARIDIEKYDVCVALGNLLDNAVEACRKVSNPDDRQISVSIMTRDGQLIINIVNTAERMTVNNMKTDKKNTVLHGYGIGNVESIAEKYGGVFLIERRESSCEATLVLPVL